MKGLEVWKKRVYCKRGSALFEIFIGGFLHGPSLSFKKITTFVCQILAQNFLHQFVTSLINYCDTQLCIGLINAKYSKQSYYILYIGLTSS